VKADAAPFSDADLSYLIRVLVPGCQDRERMVRALREDEEILEGMLNDQRLFKALMEDPESVMQVSPRLFFSVLLNRVKATLKQSSYTIEKQAGVHLAVFDSGKVYRFVDNRTIRNYLADMLCSFVHINSFSIPVRVRKGVWRRYRFSDFDVDSMLRYSETLSEMRRYPTYKRIADICLFTMGIFPERTAGRGVRRSPSAGITLPLAQKGEADLESCGRQFYRMAAEHAKLLEQAAGLEETIDTLLSLSENFALAVKPLTVMAQSYLEPFKDELFLQKE
jgi:hypothetical protein